MTAPSSEALFDLNRQEMLDSSPWPHERMCRCGATGDMDCLPADESATGKQPLHVDLDQVPERSLLIATGAFFYVQNYGAPLGSKGSAGSFERCTIRPIPSKPGDTERRFEVLAMGASRADQFMVTTAEHVEMAELVWSEVDS